MVKTENFEKVEVSSTAELRDWLQANYTQEESVWLVTYKKSVPEKYVSVSEVLDELIAFGWIDGIRRKLDETRTMQLIAPRQTQHWLKTYKDRANKLVKEGRMTQAGQESIARSKQLGLWNFLDDVDALVKPDDLLECLKQHKGALAFFDALSPSNQRFILRWIKLAKTGKTRQKRILETAVLSSKGEKMKGL